MDFPHENLQVFQEMQVNATNAWLSRELSDFLLFHLRFAYPLQGIQCRCEFSYYTRKPIFKLQSPTALPAYPLACQSATEYCQFGVQT